MTGDEGTYAAELDRCCEILQPVLEVGKVKAIGRREVAAGLRQLIEQLSPKEATFPLKECDTGGMMISLDGTLLRAAEALGRSRANRHLVFPLRQLVEHIEELRRSNSDTAALSNLADFLSTWVKQ